MKKLLSLLALVLCVTTVQAQNTASQCYRGFADAGYTIGVGDYDFGRFEINTSHGYQIIPQLYVGAGAGLHFMPKYKYQPGDLTIPMDQREAKVDIPVFANVRGTFLKTKFAPFVDAKVGTYVTNGGGLYYNISAGLRISTIGKQAVNIMVGYTSEKLEFESFHKFVSSYSMDYTTKPRKLDCEGVSIKVGYEF